MISARKSLPHGVPLWIDPNKEVYFITICCQQRNVNQLAKPIIAQALFETLEFRQAQGWCFVHLFLIMPDHVHGLFSFPPIRRTIKSVISKWKDWTSKTIGIKWQRDFFEHRLRREESRRQKADYILENPVRLGLVDRPEAWPYVWFPKELGLQDNVQSRKMTRGRVHNGRVSDSSLPHKGQVGGSSLPNAPRDDI